MARLLVGTLVASNCLLLAHVLIPEKVRRRWLRYLLGRVLPSLASPTPEQRNNQLGELLGKDYAPPLPQPIADALERSCLCFLATAGATLEPHLSLMRYSYTAGLDPSSPEPTEVMVISTQRKTKKFEILTENENVALLVHDFQTHLDGDEDNNYEALGNRGKFSITLNGSVRVETGELAEKYRAIHLTRNEKYRQFIVGPDIAIITVHLTRARICDVNDHVTHFSKTGTTWAEGQSPK